MNILKVATEDFHFPYGGAPNIDTTAGRFRTSGGYARCALSASATPLRSDDFKGGAVTAAWLAFRHYYIPGANAQSYLVGGLLKDSTSGVGLWTYVVARNKIRLVTFDGSNIVTLATEVSNSITGLQQIAMEVVDFGEDATVRVYVDGSKVIEYTGDVTMSGAMTSMSAIGLCGMSSGANWLWDYSVMSEFIVADADPRALGVVTLAPSALGDTHQWTGDYTDVNEVTLSDATVVTVDADAQEEQFALTNMPEALEIAAVILDARVAAASDATAKKLSLGVKSGGTVDVDTARSIGTGWELAERTMAQNPVTAAAWTKSDVDALQAELKSAV